MSIEGRSSTAQYLLNKRSVERTQKHGRGHVRQEQRASEHKNVERDRASRETCSIESGARPSHGSGSSASGLGIIGMETMSAWSSNSASGTNSTGDVRSQRASEDPRSSSRSSFFDFDQSDSIAKSLFAKGGRALRHHRSKLSLSSSVSFEKDSESGQVFWTLSGLGARVLRQRQDSSSTRSKYCCGSLAMCPAC